MRSSTFRSARLCALLPLALLALPKGGCFSDSAEQRERGAAHGPLKVTLASSKAEYTLGEPVVLCVQVENAGSSPLRAHEVVAHEYAICPDFLIYAATDGSSFEKFTPAGCENVDMEREIQTLAPGASWRYRLRLLHTEAHGSGLAFPKPGAYRVKVEFPFLAVERSKSARVPSNVIEVRIKEPGTTDKKAWKTVRSPGFLYLLQWGVVTGDYEDIPFEAAELLKSMPKSSYHDDLRWALREYYKREQGRGKFDEHEAQLFREILGIKVPHPQPFPEDKRLDQIITYHFPELKPWPQVFEKISNQSGVKLRLHPELRVRRMKSLRVTEPLREFMRHRAAYKAEWVRQGNGYLLKPAENTEGEQETPSQSDE